MTQFNETVPGGRSRLHGLSVAALPVLLAMALIAVTPPAFAQIIPPVTPPPDIPPPPEEELDSATRIAETPTDPVSGNPVGLFYTMSVNAFESGLALDDPARASADGTVGPEYGGVEVGQESLAIFGAGVQYGRFTTDGTDAESWTLPLYHSFLLGDSGYAIHVDLPLAYTTIEDDSFFTGSASVGVRVPVIEGMWSVTPAVRFGLVNSNALQAGVWSYGGSVTSDLRFRIGDAAFQVGNMVAHYRASETTLLQDDTLGYDPQNTIIRNGVAVTYPFQAFGEDMTGTVFATDTRFFGDEAFVEQFNEFGFTIGWERPSFTDLTDRIRLGGTFSRNQEGTGFKLNMGYRF